MLYKQSLKRFGRDIITVYSAEDICRTLDDHTVELVLFDSSLAAQVTAVPEIVRKLNQEGPVIFLCEGQGHQAPAGLAPAAVLSKPVPLDRLCDEVERMLKPGLAEVIEHVRSIDTISALRELITTVPEWAVGLEQGNTVEELAGALEELAAACRRLARPEPSLPETRVNGMAVEPVPEPDAGTPYLREKEYVCAVCRARFYAELMDETILTEESRTPDGRVTYREAEPLLHEIIVCSGCLYAARDTDFQEPAANPAAREKISRERVGRKIMVGDLTFDGEPTVKHAIAAFLLAASCYRHYRERDYVGNFFLRASWLCNEIGDEQSEQEYLERALEHYMAAYESMAQAGETGSRTALCYIIGEILRKLGRKEESLEYFDQVITGESGPAGPDILNKARAQRSTAQGEPQESPPESARQSRRDVCDELEDEVL